MPDPNPENSLVNEAKDAAKWLWDHKESVKRVCRWLLPKKRLSPSDSPAPELLIVGSGGVGKSTLGRILAQEHGLLFDALGAFKESDDMEKYEIKDGPGAEILVPPGQDFRLNAVWGELMSDIAAGRFRGIVLVGSYGRHALSHSYKSHREYPRFKNKEKFLKWHLQNRREKEIEILRQLAPFVKSCPSRLWLMTLVVKQDLWWPIRHEVEAFYRNGDYAKELSAVLAKEGKFRHEHVFASMVISNLYTGTAEVLSKNSEGYDHSMQLASLKGLFEVFESLRKWEDGK